jgi:CHASE2 domain-containing sensor protein
MSMSLTHEERRADQLNLWSDVVLFGLTFVLAWFVTGRPQAVRAWPTVAQFLYHALTCAAIVAGLLTLRSQRPVGFMITFMAYGLIAASQVLKSGGVWLGLAAVAIIAGMLIADTSQRFRAGNAAK